MFWPAVFMGRPASEMDLLAQERIAWATWRDTLCHEEAEEEAGGSIALYAETACHVRLTVERVTGLRDVLLGR